ncbi:predicted protein [Scheffersomyces stipitis CBS 6054]|uniref:Uncharacterized protein n=1 Tax=Scheffersomyces stipitis (strain ATCC 58785 / CBS 6054 / NBRC 10063 / NRRL Y-11545) TaxID=322104 RepID=A3LV35_PICST|nr:predicted protein [Scheffersomyces stipitis CBS 6054]ABN66703.2 predicted protein [Scheffersomyces stipitis CBS 6054]
MDSVVHFDLYPEHFYQKIIDELPFLIVLVLACNSSSPYQRYLLNSIYKEIEIQYISPSPGLRLEFLKQFYLLRYNVINPSDEKDYVPCKVVGKNVDSLVTFLNENPSVAVRHLRLVAIPSEEVIAKVRSLSDRIGKITFISARVIDEQQDASMNWPTERDAAYLCGLRMHLDLNFSDPTNYSDTLSELLFKLRYPPRLEFLSLSGGKEAIDSKVFSRFPRTIKSLILDLYDIQCDGFLKLNLPPFLKFFSCTVIVDKNNRCFDISHLSHLTEVKLFFYYHLIPLSIFRFPRSLQTLSVDSGLSSSGMEQLAELDQLKQVTIRVYRSPNNPVPILREAVHLPNSIEDLSIQDYTIDGDVDGAYFIPKSTKKLQLQNSYGLYFISELSVLESLHISYTSCRIPHLQNLNTLVIKSVEIDSVSMWKDVHRLTNLKHMSINDCELDCLNCTLPSFLETLDVSRNNIEEADIILPANFKSLDISHNEICKFSAKGRLLTLNLDTNRMSELSNSTLCIPCTVCELNMSNNDTISISSDFSFPESVKVLRLDYNFFSDYTVLFKMPSQILLLSLDSSFFLYPETKEPTPVIMNYPKLWHFSMTSSIGTEYLDFNWNGCPNLESILMNGCKFEIIKLENLPPSVKIVDFSDCKVRKVEGRFERLPHLIEFNLEDNRLAPGVETFGKMGMGYVSQALRW